MRKQINLDVKHHILWDTLYSMSNLTNLAEAYPTLGDHDLSKLKPRLPDNALNQVTAFLVSYFLSRFLKMFPCIFLCKIN